VTKLLRNLLTFVVCWPQSMFTYHKISHREFLIWIFRVRTLQHNIIFTCDDGHTNNGKQRVTNIKIILLINSNLSYQQHCFQNGIQNRSSTGFTYVHERATSLRSIKYENCQKYFLFILGALSVVSLSDCFSICKLLR